MKMNQNIAKFEDFISANELSEASKDNTVVAGYANKNLVERAIRALYLSRMRLDQVSVLGKLDPTRYPIIVSIATPSNFSEQDIGLNPFRFGPWRLLSNVGLFTIRKVGCVIAAGRIFQPLLAAHGRTAADENPLGEAFINFGFSAYNADDFTAKIDRGEFLLIAGGDSTGVQKTENLLSLMRAQYVDRFAVAEPAWAVKAP